MKSKLGIVLGILLAVCCASVVCAQAPPSRGGQVLATVGEFNVTPPYVDYIIRNHFARDIMYHIVRDRAIQDEAQARGIKVSHAQVTQYIDKEKEGFPTEEAFLTSLHNKGLSLKGYREQVYTRFVLDALMAQQANITDEEALKYFEDHQSEYGSVPQLHILDLAAASADDARVAYRAILDGTPFSVAARRFASDPDAGDGDLGWVSEDTIPVEGLWDFAQALEEGQITAPFALGGKYHIVSLVGRRAGASVDFESVKGDIMTKLRQGRGVSEEDYVTGLISKAYVTVSWAPVAYLDSELKQLKGVRVTVDGRGLDLSPTPYLLDDGTPMVPAKPVLRAIRADLSWRPEPKILEARRDNLTAQISIGEKTFVADGVFTDMKGAAIIKDGTTFIAPEAVLTSLGVRVAWNPATRLLAITTVSE